MIIRNMQLSNTTNVSWFYNVEHFLNFRGRENVIATLRRSVYICVRNFVPYILFTFQSLELITRSWTEFERIVNTHDCSG